MKKESPTTAKTLIIVEGESDKKFLTELCNHKDVELRDIDIRSVSPRGGKSEFFGKKYLFETDKITAHIEKTSNFPLNILLICDADFKESKVDYSGFAATKAPLNVVKSKLEKVYRRKRVDFFIIPNHEKDGNLESLFLQCATKKVGNSSNCVDTYLKCLTNKSDKELSEDLEKKYKNKKDKLYSHLLIAGLGYQEGFNNVGDVANKNEYWNFNHKSLEPLKEFLKKFK